MIHCIFIRGVNNQHFQSSYLEGRERVTKKEYSVYDFDVDDSGRPLTLSVLQGSEVSTVVYVTGPAGCQTWQHVYTAVTRGRHCVIVVTRQSDLRRAVGRQPQRRNTSLQERMREKLDHMRVSNGYLFQFVLQLPPELLAPSDGLIKHSCGMFRGLRDIIPL